MPTPTKDELRARIMAAPSYGTPGPWSVAHGDEAYTLTMYATAKAILAWATPEQIADPECDLYAVVRAREPKFDVWVGGNSAFTEGQAVRLVRFLAAD